MNYNNHKEIANKEFEIEGIENLGKAGTIIIDRLKEVNQNRAKLIEQKKLMDKVADEKELTGEDYSLIGDILCSLRSRKERINYLFIFGLSAVALLLAIYFDFLR
ncbi:hypothetical protein KAX35_08135 [candidate division WOR-3 bacterium]|nr:hypothetical protein [candidate division WOR-3 bacterium]MCK4329113.1 hypothetical protein [candidate division WOR-3 bacterium]